MFCMKLKKLNQLFRPQPLLGWDQVHVYFTLFKHNWQLHPDNRHNRLLGIYVPGLDIGRYEHLYLGIGRVKDKKIQVCIQVLMTGCKIYKFHFTSLGHIVFIIFSVSFYNDLLAVEI